MSHVDGVDNGVNYDIHGKTIINVGMVARAISVRCNDSFY